MEERRHEEPMSKNGGTTSNMSPEETGQTEWMGFIVSAIKNLHVHDHQHTDGHSSNEILHDIGTQVAVLWRWRPILILFCFPIQMCVGRRTHDLRYFSTYIWERYSRTGTVQ
jgi:hypothetical protein